MSLLAAQASDRSKYLVFDVIDEKPKTIVVSVMSKNHGDILGYIKWYGKWRQYVFSPENFTLFNNGCLHEIEDFITTLMQQRKDKTIPN